jgi:hypothetical protein
MSDPERIVKAANAWIPGNPIPSELLTYSSSHAEGSCFPLSSGTKSIVYGITNYYLLRDMAFRPKIDPRIFTNVVTRAIVVGGATRFLSDIQKKQGLPQALKAQVGVKHVVVDSLWIDFADMSPSSAKDVLNQIKEELAQGKSFHNVYWKYLEKYEYPVTEKFGDGTSIKMTRTMIGNLGDFVLPLNKNPLFSYRESYMPKEHLTEIFGSKIGDILILFDKQDLRDYPLRKGTGERYVLHRIREVYP